MIKLIACDLDGTVLDDEKRIDTGLKELVDKLKKQGIMFTLVSGRNRELIKDIVTYFDIDVPYICNNGANIYCKDQLIDVDCIPKEHVNDAAHLLYDAGIVFRVYCLEDVFYNGISDFFLARMKGFKKPLKTYSPDLDLQQYRVVKMTADLIGNQDKMEALRKSISSFPRTEFVKVEDHICCVNSTTANKGDSLRKVCGYLGIDAQEEAMSFGDNENDLPMLNCCKISVAMGNSEEILKEKADYICLDNNHNGVSEFLKEYFKSMLNEG